MEAGALQTTGLVPAATADVGTVREERRLRRLRRLAVVLAGIVAVLAWRAASGAPVRLGVPSRDLPPGAADYLPGLLLVVMLGLVLVVPLLAAGRSPHAQLQPSELAVRFDDVVGLGVVREEVIRTLNLFLAYRTFREQMGGTPRRAILFEGPPGTGKTHMAKAMAAEAGVPFLFVSASAFQSMYYGQTNRKIRAFFRALRRVARREGGAIGFIEEIDAIAGARRGMRASPLPEPQAGAGVHRADMRDGIPGVVNELLVQMQSFDDPTLGSRIHGWLVDRANRLLPAHRRLRKRPPVPANILVIGATNRAADLDPALLRPGRFDRSIHFDLPNRTGRREIIDYYLARKAHVPELDKEERRDHLATMTMGYSPVMIEHLLDEALVWALRDGRDAMDWADIQQAKLTEEIGLAQPVEYTPEERRIIATHEAGHAVIAWLVAGSRQLDVLSIVKRRDALGLLAHSDTEERFTRTRSELLAAIQICFGGMTAEELFFGEAGTGPGSDLVAATRLACQMVGAFGMAGTLVSFEAASAGPLDAGLVARVLADDAGRREVERILERAKHDVRGLLDGHRHLVEALRDALLDREELVGDEIVEVLTLAGAGREANGAHLPDR